MDAFDRIVAAYGARPYAPEGNGYWSDGLPCPTCGSISVVLDPVPACVVCTDRIESMRVDAELMLRHLDSVVGVASLLPAEAKAELRGLAVVANVQMQKLLRAVIA